LHCPEKVLMSIPFVPAVDNACCLVIANFALTSPLYIRGVISTEVDFDVDQRGVEEGFGLFDVSIRSAPTGEARLATACVLLNTRNNLVYDFSF
jgi:hypothetical protein